MPDLWFVTRDLIGENSTVIIDGAPVVIKDLPAGRYELTHDGKVIASGVGPNTMPGTILNYCGDLARERKEAFRGGGTPYDMVSNLEIQAKRVN
jgi:hypothetical protein